MATRKKKTTRKKKKTTESRYTVKKSRSNAGSVNTDDDSVVAKDGAEAVQKAMKNDPQAGKYDSVEVKKDTGGGGVRTVPDTVSKVKPETEGMAGYESVNFPYNIGLPMGFKALFESLPKRVCENLTFGTRYGKLHIQVPDAKTMKSFVSEVEKKARGKTKMKHLASVVANGINESVKK